MYKLRTIHGISLPGQCNQRVLNALVLSMPHFMVSEMGAWDHCHYQQKNWGILLVSLSNMYYLGGHR